MGKSLIPQRWSWVYKPVVKTFMAEICILAQALVSLMFASALHVFTCELMWTEKQVKAKSSLKHYKPFKH